MFSQHVTFSVNLHQSLPQSGPKITFGWHFEHIWGHVAGFLASFGAFVARLGAHCGFSGISWGRAYPRSLPAARAERALATWENSIWASRVRVLPREYAHPAKLRYVPPAK